MGILGTRKPRSSKIKQPRRCWLERQSRDTSKVTTALSESPPSPLSPGGKHTATRRLPHLRNIPGPRRVLKSGVTQDLVTFSTPCTAAIAPAPEETAGQPSPTPRFPCLPRPRGRLLLQASLGSTHLGTEALVSQPPCELLEYTHQNTG